MALDVGERVVADNGELARRGVFLVADPVVEGLDFVAVNHHIGHILAEEDACSTHTIASHCIIGNEGVGKDGAHVDAMHSTVLDSAVLDDESTLALFTDAVVGRVDDAATFDDVVIGMVIVGNAVHLARTVSIKVDAAVGPLHGLVGDAIVGRSFGLAVPIGISFVTFSLISFLCDVYREKEDVPRFFDFVL